MQQLGTLSGSRGLALRAVCVCVRMLRVCARARRVCVCAYWLRSTHSVSMRSYAVRRSATTPQPWATAIWDAGHKAPRFPSSAASLQPCMQHVCSRSRDGDAEASLLHTSQKNVLLGPPIRERLAPAVRVSLRLGARHAAIRTLEPSA